MQQFPIILVDIVTVKQEFDKVNKIWRSVLGVPW